MELRWVLWVSVIFFLIACISHPFQNMQTQRGMYVGGACLLFGWMSILVGDWIALVAWSANIPYIVVVVASFMQKKGNWTFWLAILAVVLSLATFFIKKMLIHEGGEYAPVKAYLGFYLWLSSFITLCVYRYLLYNQTS